MPAEELRAIEDEAIADAIRMQEDIGLKAVTDGEYRRLFWHYDFMEMLTGFEFEMRELARCQVRRRAPAAALPDDHGQARLPPTTTRCSTISDSWPPTRR